MPNLQPLGKSPSGQEWPELQIQSYVGTEEHFKLVDWERSEARAGTIWVQVYDENGKALSGVAAEHFWPQPRTDTPYDGAETRAVEMKDNGAEVQPIAEFEADPRTSGFDGQGHGPHNVRVLPCSDVVFGAGTQGNRHFFYRFVYRRVLAGTITPPTADVAAKLRDLERRTAALEAWKIKTQKAFAELQ
jgi:hypothetical protein